MIAVTSVTDRATVRRDIVTRATDYVLERGLNDLSLRPLAAALGTSARMLV
jgi:AcrR family transcriptional regulator